MKTIRKSRAKDSDSFADSAVMDLPQGAHLKIKSVKVFPPKFHEETGDLWSPSISIRNIVVDDRTEDGEFDGAEFTDRLDLKVDLDVLDSLGLDDAAVRNSNADNFNAKERQVLSDPENWTIRAGSKADNLISVVLGKDWAEKPFDPEYLVDNEFIAKVKPREGKRPGSYCAWDTFMSITPPKKKKKAAAKKSVEDEIVDDLTEAEEAAMKEALG